MTRPDSPSALQKIQAAPLSVRFVQASDAVEQIAGLLSTDLRPDQLASAQQQIKELTTALVVCEENVKKRLVAIALEEGTEATEKGTKRVTKDGWTWGVRPWRNTLDDKKVEALLRAKGLSVDTWMDKKVTYAANEDRLKDAVAKKKLTADEMETCRWDYKPVLETPKKVTEEATNDE